MIRHLCLILFALQLGAANIYVRSTDGNDSDDGSTWALAKATLSAGITAAGSGGTVYVSDNHAESTAAAITLAMSSTPSSPTVVLCSDDAAEPPTASATTCTVSTTGVNSHITYTGFGEFRGITFTAGASANAASHQLNSASPWALTFIDSKLVIGNTSGTSRINIGVTTGGDDQMLTLINTPLQFGSTSHTIQLGSVRWNWHATASAIQGTVPTVLITPTSTSFALVTSSGVDLSAIVSGKNLIAPSTNAVGYMDFNFSNCKLDAAGTILSNAINGPGGAIVRLDNCDSGDTNYKIQHYKYQGTITSEASILRVGGSSDGTTNISWKMTTLSSGASYSFPLFSPRIFAWNDATASTTASIEIIHDSATALTDKEVWIECEHLSGGSFPGSAIVSDAAGPLATAAAQTTSGVSWTNSMSNPNRQKLVTPSFTPAEKGIVSCRVSLAKANYTIYVDPVVTLQ